jgi:GDPmannose 4,6-dehydratase
MKRRALITGITGQDGSYLAEFLLSKGYEVHGMIRRVASEAEEHRIWRIRHLLGKLQIHGASLESYPSVCKVFQAVQPEECYHLAAQSYVSYSFEDEFSTFNTNINGTHNVLAGLLLFAPACRFYFAGSSEMFGNAEQSPQNESTPFHPRSTYAISKVTGYHLARYYREAYKVHVCCGILFNHESPRRGFEFVTRKISYHLAKIKLGLAEELSLGDIESRRDWGHAREYVGAMWQMLQQDRPDDYVIATGQGRSVREFLELAFSHVGLDYRDWVKFDPKLTRPADVVALLGDASKAQRILGWEHRISFKDLIVEMVEADLEFLGEKVQTDTHQLGARHALAAGTVGAER